MTIDCHTHIFPPQICNQREAYFKNEPAFSLLYDSPRSKLITSDQLIEMMDHHHIDQSIIFGFPWKQSHLFQMNNDYILETVAKYPQRVIGFCTMDIENSKSLADAERCLNNGLKGIGELAFYDSDMSIDLLEPFMSLCKIKSCPLMLHTNEPVGHIYPGKTANTLNQLYQIAKRFPDNTIIYAHWGGGLFFYNLLKKEVQDTLKNVYFDTAASPFLYNTSIWQMADSIIGSHKILFGTDYPLLSPDRYFNEINQSGLEQNKIDLILGKNIHGLIYQS